MGKAIASYELLNCRAELPSALLLMSILKEANKN